MFAVLAGLCWGVGEVFTKSVLHSKEVGPLTAIAARSAVALPVLVAVAWFVGRRLEEPSLWKAESGTLWKLALGSGLLAGAGGMAFFYLALSFGEVSRVKPIAFVLAPTTAVLLGVLALGEPFTVKKALGVALVLGGLVVLSVK